MTDKEKLEKLEHDRAARKDFAEELEDGGELENLTVPEALALLRQQIMDNASDVFAGLRYLRAVEDAYPEAVVPGGAMLDDTKAQAWERFNKIGIEELTKTMDVLDGLYDAYETAWGGPPLPDMDELLQEAMELVPEDPQ